MRNTYISLCALLLWCVPLSAQDNPGLFENGGAYINSSNADGYLSPLVKTLNNSWHAGLFQASDLRDSFFFYLGLNVNVGLISNKMKSFEGKTAAPFSPEMTAEVPTIFGVNETTLLEDPEGWAYVFPGGLEMKNFPLAVPQITIGGIAHTSLTFRFVGFALDEDLGRFNVLGLAVQHDLTPYLSFEHFHLTAELAYHRVKTGTWFRTQHFLLRSSIVQQKGLARWYGFLGVQSGSLTLIDQAENIEYISKAKNPLLIGAGASVDLAFINLGLEASYSALPTLNFNLGFKF